MQTKNEKIKLIGYLILGEIKFWNLKKKKKKKKKENISRKRVQKVKKT